jgi:hypothetical protein
MLHGALVYENGENYESPIGVELGLNWFTGPKPQKPQEEEQQQEETEQQASAEENTTTETTAK